MGLTHELASSYNLTDLNRLRVVQANIPFGLPLAFVLVEGVKVSRSVVKEDARRGEVVQDFRRLPVTDLLEETTFLLPVDDVEGLLSDGTKMDEHLHADTAGEKRFICCFAHLEKKLDPRIFTLPWQHVRVAFNDHHFDQVESLNRVKKVGSFILLDLPFHCACYFDLTPARTDDPKW